jgi:hypothetical protein
VILLPRRRFSPRALVRLRRPQRGSAPRTRTSCTRRCRLPEGMAGVAGVAGQGSAVEACWTCEDPDSPASTDRAPVVDHVICGARVPRHAAPAPDDVRLGVCRNDRRGARLLSAARMSRGSCTPQPAATRHTRRDGGRPYPRGAGDTGPDPSDSAASSVTGARRANRGAATDRNHRRLSGAVTVWPAPGCGRGAAQLSSAIAAPGVRLPGSVSDR